VLPRGGGTKPALSTSADTATLLDLSALSGMVEYDPAEFTFTASAGTRVADICRMVEEHGQYLPFDPPLVEQGATLGGTVASGLSGPGRYRYGGVRDFILSIQYVDSEGRLVRGGARVVKNAAGFDLPKLMTGSLGSLGVLVELTFKLFPKPQAYITLQFSCSNLEDSLEALYRITSSPLDLIALDFAPSPAGITLWARLGGFAEELPGRAERIYGLLGEGEMIEGQSESMLWRDAREFAWSPAGWSLIKVPATPRRIPLLEASLTGVACLRRYSSGGQVAWIASSGEITHLDRLLAANDFSGLVIRGPAGSRRLGARAGDSFARRVKQALDPGGRFVEV
jgi:glycolate oxidase FAD binding subunit